MPPKKTPSSSSWFARGVYFLMRVAFLFLCAFFIFGIYLDAKIRQRFEGEKWQLPSLVYSRPLELFAGQRLTQQQMLHELTLLKYEQTKHPPSRPGEYQREGNHFYIFRRAFEFPDGREGVKPLQLYFEDERLTAIEDPASGRDLSYVRMDPVLLDRLHLEQREDRILITLKQVPDLLVNTLLTVEDQTFYTHWGISLSSIGRALVSNLRAGRTVQGGSTITQQLAKNFFLTRKRSLWRKLQEVYMALIIDQRYTKSEILEAYLNEVYLGQNFAKGVYGMGLASYFYFGRPVNELEAHQIALLIAVIKGPSHYDPWRYKERSLARRDLVLRLIFESGYLSVAQYKNALKEPLDIIPRGRISFGKTPAFMGWLRHELIDKIGENAATQSGLKIFTSLDPIAQRSAETAVRKTLEQLDPKKKQKGTPFETAVVISDWRKSHLIAMVGGRKPEFAGFNRAMDASRQIGSLAKPAVYLTALKQQYQLATRVEDNPITLTNAAGQAWSPRNVDNQFRGEISFLEGLARSLNVPTVNIGMDVGLPNVIETLRQLGVKTPLNPFPSLLLGAFTLTPIQVNQMYLTLANQGVYQPLSAITAVFKSNAATPIYVNPQKTTRTIEANVAWLTLWALTQVVEQGSGRSLKTSFPSIQIAAKTGSTNDFRDAWFTGIDNEELVTIWLGKDDNSRGKFMGSNGPLNIYRNYLKERGLDNLKLFVPEGIEWAHFSTLSGLQVPDTCSESVYLPARAELLTEMSACENTDKPNWLQRLFKR